MKIINGIVDAISSVELDTNEVVIKSSQETESSPSFPLGLVLPGFPMTPTISPILTFI